MNKATNMSSEWIARVMRENPSRLLDNGNIRTCPVRLSFPNIFKPGKPNKEGKVGKFGSVLLFPLGADMKPYIGECMRITGEKLPAALKPGGPRINNPILRVKSVTDPTLTRGDPDDHYDGYVVGAPVLRCNSPEQRPCVDQRLAPITDHSRVYPGVWAICAVRVFWFDTDGNKGPSFGLQSVMIIADDQNLGGGSTPAADFAGVNIDSSINPAEAFGTGGTAGQTAQEPVESLFG
jgi:hypothetical protein